MTNTQWYTLRTKPHKENQVYSFLSSHDVETFYPIIRVKPVNPRAAKIRPFFPGYLFVKVDLEQIRIAVLQWMPGAVGLVHFCGQIAPVPEPFINQAKQRISQIEQAGGLHMDGLKRGDPI